MKNMKNMKNCENYEKLIYLNPHLNYFGLQPNFLYFTAMLPARGCEPWSGCEPPPSHCPIPPRTHRPQEHKLPVPPSTNNLRCKNKYI